ncbi:MAG: hypothetical protein ABIH25_02150 [Candidatus Woesearchaeota archaeon]
MNKFSKSILLIVVLIILSSFDLSASDLNESNSTESRKEIKYIIDFRIKDNYVLDLYTNDKVNVVFDDATIYKFEVSYLEIYDYMIISLENVDSYLIKWGDRGFLDFDNDGGNDLEISYLDKQVKWTKLGGLNDESSLFPNFESKVDRDSADFSLSEIFLGNDVFVLLVWVFVIILIMFIIYFFMVRRRKNT